MVSDSGEYDKAIMVDGVVYWNTGFQMVGEPVDVQSATSYTNGVPTEEGQVNWGEGEHIRYAVTVDGVLVSIDNEWVLFEPEEEIPSVGTNGGGQDISDFSDLDHTYSENWSDGLSFVDLAPGEEQVGTEAIIISEGTASVQYTITYSRASLSLEIGLRSEAGKEYCQDITGGAAEGSWPDMPAGSYQIFVRNVDEKYELPDYNDNPGWYLATGAINYSI